MAAQWDSGDMLTIDGLSCWFGLKSFVPRGISRIEDGNAIDAIEYDASIYTYTAGTVPSGAANTYAADFANTPPAAPTGLSVVSQGTNQATAYALIRVTTPPASNWAFLVAQIRNNSTGEIAEARLELNGGNYEATLTGLKTGSGHTVFAFAVNGNNVKGATVSTTFTTPGPAQYISDSHITTSGVSGTSIASASINRSRSNTGTGSTSVSLTTGSPLARVTLDVYTFFPKTGDKNSVSGHCYFVASETRNASLSGDEAQFDIYWDGTSGIGQVAYINYRTFNA
jgi:hypothetical protein